MAPLFILAFDHRATFAENLLGFNYQKLNRRERERVSELKGIVFHGFLEVWKKMGRPKNLAVLLDEEFGRSSISQAKKLGITLAIPVEKSGQKIFTFEFGNEFGSHLKKIRPSFAKALVRYDVARKKQNALQRARLRKLSQFCRKQSIEFILEVLLTGKGSRLAQGMRMLADMARDDIQPTLWKLEGLPSGRAWRKLRECANARILLLGRGASETQVSAWVKTAAESGVVDGFAIGRTIFSTPLKGYVAGRMNKKDESKQIAKKFSDFIRLWKHCANDTEP